MMLSFQSIGDEHDDGGEVGMRPKKMGFDIGVGRFNSRGCSLVEMGNSFGVSVGKFFCHREPNRIKIFLKRGREFGREGEKGSLEFRG